MRSRRSILLFVLSTSINMCLALPATAASAPRQSDRIVHFPADRPLGRLYLQMPSPGKDSKPRLERTPTDCGEYSGKAQGDVRVPADGQLTLMVDPGIAADLSGFLKLQPDDLYGIAFPPGPGGISGGAGDAVMPHIAHLTGLKSLGLSFTIVTDAGMKHVASLKSLEYLGTTAQVTDKGMAYVGQLTTLRFLGLYGPSPVTDAGLEHVGKLTSLEELALVGDHMGDAGLAHLGNLQRLKWLELFGAGFGDSGMIHLKQLAALKKLSFPDGKAFIFDAGLAQIAEIPNLEELSLNARGDVTDEGLAHLVKLRSLKKLNLPGAHLTDKGCAYLQQIKTLETLEGSQGNQRITDAGILPITGSASKNGQAQPGVTLSLLRVGGICPLDG